MAKNLPIKAKATTVTKPQAALRTARETEKATAGLLVRAVSVATIKDELEAGEWIAKPDVCGMGRFNIVGASKRNNTYKNETKVQVVFEFQFLDGDIRGTRALCSFDENMVRTKYHDAVKRHGAIGPLVLTTQESDEPGVSAAYIFAEPDNTEVDQEDDLAF